MAITTLIPTFDIPKVRRAILNLVPGGVAQDRISTQRFKAIIIAVVVVDVLVIATLNILMTQDAFVLQKLKQERNIVQDQRDAALRQASIMGSPGALSASAHKLGMVAVQEIKYLDFKVKP